MEYLVAAVRLRVGPISGLVVQRTEGWPRICVVDGEAVHPLALEDQRAVEQLVSTQPLLWNEAGEVHRPLEAYALDGDLAKLAAGREIELMEDDSGVPAPGVPLIVGEDLALEIARMLDPSFEEGELFVLPADPSPLALLSALAQPVDASEIPWTPVETGPTGWCIAAEPPLPGNVWALTAWWWLHTQPWDDEGFGPRQLFVTASMNAAAALSSAALFWDEVVVVTLSTPLDDAVLSALSAFETLSQVIAPAVTASGPAPSFAVSVLGGDGPGWDLRG